MIAAPLLLVACSGEQQPDTGGGGGSACGSPSSFDVEVIAAVTGAGQAIEGIEVAVEDRAWNPGTLGQAATDSAGTATIQALGVTDLPGCWGTMLDYELVVTDPQAAWLPAEKGINSWLYRAIDDGSLVADMTGVPVELEPAEDGGRQPAGRQEEGGGTRGPGASSRPQPAGALKPRRRAAGG